MEQKTNTLSVPYSYARCYNEQCRQAENCLRRMAALYDTADYPFITILNPVRFPKADGNCSYFQKAEKVRMAWGVKGLLDKIPYEDAVSIKQQLISGRCFVIKGLPKNRLLPVTRMNICGR